MGTSEEKTNLEWLQGLSAEKLAPLLVKTVHDPVSSLGTDGETEGFSFSVEKNYYMTSDRICFDDYNSACRHEEVWLNSRWQGKDGGLNG